MRAQLPKEFPGVTVRVYGPLNDFLPARRRQVAWTHAVDGHPSVKDVIESLGVPHPEIDRPSTLAPAAATCTA
jgi:hypothetical protein